MTTSHTPGRLKLSFGKKYQWDYMINSAEGTPIAYFGHYKPMTIKEGKANARRLVACWNACEGISTEDLEKEMPATELALEHSTVISQRDELLEALKGVQMMAVCGQLDAFIGEPWLRAVSAAIAKAEGEA